MKRTSLLGVIFATLALGSAAAPDFLVPALNEPATSESHPGKFVWADLFTADPAASRKFYTDLFGWKWQVLGEAYAVAYVNGLPVAGAVHRPTVQGETGKARWVGFIAVADIAATDKSVSVHGGRTVLEPRAIANRGQVAVFADAEGVLFGAVQSSSGDPADYEAATGEWSWTQLFSGAEAKATDFYRAVFGYEVQAAAQKGSYLMREGLARAGLSQLAEENRQNPQWLGFIRVASLADTVARAKTLGGSIQYQSENPHVAIIADPAGALVGVIEPANTGGK